MLDAYQSNLAGLLLACGILWATSRPREQATTTAQEGDEEVEASAKRTKGGQHVGVQNSQRAFVIVYALVMGSDWLQVSLSRPGNDLFIVSDDFSLLYLGTLLLLAL